MGGVIRIGTAAWAIPKPLQPDFPESGSQLEKYAARLTAVEINSSFYRPHQRKTYERWAAATPEAFRFCVKLPRGISHNGRLQDFEKPLARFLDEVSGLGRKLGMILVQLPPSLRFDDRIADTFFGALAGHAVACEPRHASWFTPRAEALLLRHGVARVAADPPRHADDGVPGGACRLAYWRWHGAPRIYWSAYETWRLAELAAAIRATPAKETWCIFDNTAAGAAMADALRLMTILSDGNQT